MVKNKKNLKAYLPVILGGLFILGSIVAIVIFIANMETQPVRRERKIQPITLVPPPPPPPPPKVETLPEPEPQKIDEPVEQQVEEAIPDVADEAPPGDLGLDAEGTAGTDGFGLAARKGGRGLLGGGGAGSPFAWYGNLIKNDLLDILSDQETLRKKGYSAVVKFWLNSDGTVNRFELARGSNNSEIDGLLKSLISQYKKVDEVPPPGMGQPIKLKITSRI